MEVKKFTLITGASMGIGKAFAFECASRGMNLLLIALPDDGLEETKKQINLRFSVEIITLAIDLRDHEAVRSLYDYCIQQNLVVNMLINNAGMGAGGKFEEISHEIYTDMLHLNIRALTMLTYHFLPMLKQHAPAFILNMSSMEANFPLPYKSVYTGTKNFVYAFSLALREELSHCNVKVSVLCPGPVLTNSDGLKRINAVGNRAKMIMLMPAEVAKIGVNNLLKGQGIVVPGKINWTIVKLMKLFPTGLKMKLLERLFRVYTDH
ncbi:SDR family NAD(P)-dependent oxidoreductase [Negadavirga shengliensis]|uniref:SDR family NAD(P)-dependent oxidoreductase n=1 Tax=Negadavirga shengliensis TaxID=1389218 RepID=A0ABV9T0E0_9BACT